MTFKRIELDSGGSRPRKNKADWHISKHVDGRRLTISISADIINRTQISKGDNVILSHDPDHNMLLITKTYKSSRSTRKLQTLKNTRTCSRVIRAIYKGAITEIFRAERGELVLKRATDFDLLFLMVPGD